MGKSKAYYDSNPAAKAKKNAYQKKYMQTAKGKAIRLFADRANAKEEKAGRGGKVGDKKDYSHFHGRLVDQSRHRSGDKKRNPNKRKLRIT